MIPSQPSPELRRNLPDYFLLILIAISFLLGALLLSVFAGPIIAAIVLGVAFYPQHLRVSRWMHQRSPTAQALITDFLVLMLLIIPACLLVWVMLRELQSLGPTLKQWQTTFEGLRQGRTDAGNVRHLRDWFYDKLGMQPSQFRVHMVAAAEGISQTISDQFGSLAKNSLILLIGLMVMLLTLFFVFRNGVAAYHKSMTYIPLRAGLKTQLSHSMQKMIIAIIRGWFVTALLQGVTATLGYLIIGAPGVAFLGVMTAVAGVIPSIGTALVWLPVSLYYFFLHEYFKGGFILAWGILIVGLLDNILRPYLVGNKADIPFVALFFSLLGGIELWGTKGIILGPLIVAVAPPLFDEFKTRFLAHSETPGN